MGKNKHLGWFSWFDVIFSNAFMDSEEFELLDGWETEELCWAWVEVDAAFNQTYSGLKFLVLAGFLVEREGTYFSIPLIFTRKIELLAKCSDSQKSPWLSLLTLSWWNYVNRFQAQGQEFFSRFTAIQTYVGRFVASGWCQCGGFRRYTAGAAFGDF